MFTSMIRYVQAFCVRSGALFTSLILVLLCITGVLQYKRALTRDYATQKVQQLGRVRSGTGTQVGHPQLAALFQSSFYFYFEEQFFPGIQKNIDELEELTRIEIVAKQGKLLFDSSGKKNNSDAIEFQDADVITVLTSGALSQGPSALVQGFEVVVVFPIDGDVAAVYRFYAKGLIQRTLSLCAVLGLLLIGLGFLWKKRLSLFLPGAFGFRAFKKVTKLAFGLQGKFLVVILVINAITGGIIYYSLSQLQEREASARLKKEALLFAEFSTAQVISDFSNYYYFYFSERFVPSIKRIIASNESLMSLKIVSLRNSQVLYDSDTGLGVGHGRDESPFDLGTHLARGLQSEEVVAEELDRPFGRVLKVVSRYRDESQEPLFLVVYEYSYSTLYQSVALIRTQILKDLFPGLAIALIISTLFAGLIIRPLKRLVTALNRVKSGEYDILVDIHRSDELGDLVSAFNSMTQELKKKQELRKYLSDSTYRQIMEAPDSKDGSKMGGSRVSATILFSDIRNFVSHCENLEAEEVTSMLNEYFSEMVEVVHHHGGEVDKFIGDALLAVFYSSDESQTIRPAEALSAPQSGVTSLQAIHCALEMRERLKEFNKKRASQSKTVIEIGVGITHGEIISGPIGSKDRMDFTVIGDVVNLANRIEKLSKNGKHTKVVFSQHVEEKIRGLLEYELISSGPVKGKEEDVLVYELIRIKDLETLISNIKGDDVLLKRRSVALLGQSRNMHAVSHLIPLLTDRDEETRIAAVSALTKVAAPNDARVIEALKNRMITEKSERVMPTLIAAFGKVCHGEEMLFLARFLDSDNDRIVANAVESLGQVRDPRAVDLIISKLGSKNNRVKANAAMALFAAGKLEVLDTLKPMLMHSDPLMRASAAFAIGELTLIAHQDQLMEAWKRKENQAKVFLAELQECVPMLVSLLKDKDVMVKRNAIIALGKIKDKSAVLPLIDNLDLQNDSKEVLRDAAQALRAIGSHKLVRDILSRLSGI